MQPAQATHHPLPRLIEVHGRGFAHRAGDPRHGRRRAARLRDARLDSPSGTLVVYSRCCGYGVRYRSPSGPRLPGRVLGLPGPASGRCPCRRYLEGLRRPEGLYVRRAGLPKHGVPPVTCGCARSAVAGRWRGSQRALSGTSRGCPSRRGSPLLGTPTRSLGSALGLQRGLAVTVMMEDRQWLAR